MQVCGEMGCLDRDSLEQLYLDVAESRAWEQDWRICKKE